MGRERAMRDMPLVSDTHEAAIYSWLISMEK